jgi:hypothetical protein
MFLYKIQVKHTDGSISKIVVMAESDERAFKTAEAQLDKHYLPPKRTGEMAMLEKKVANKGVGFVIESTHYE